jgi:hypothetical protein
MKVGDLVINRNSKSSLIGLFIEWKTFDKESNPYTCPMVLWADGRCGSIQTSLLEVIND